MKLLNGKAWKYGDNIDTDVIIPGRYCNIDDPVELAKHCLEDLDADFVHKVKSGDIIVAGTNFGCGSSREVAPLTIKVAGISCVIAKSFARIFFRNSINIGLPILECPDAVDDIETGDDVEFDPAAGLIKNVRSGNEFSVHPLPDFVLGIIQAGGLMKYIARKN